MKERRERADLIQYIVALLFWCLALGYAVHLLACPSTQASSIWRVTSRGGHRILCDDVLFHPSLKEIECYDVR